MKLKIIHGAPCSGKSTFVKKHLKDSDIAYDYDALTRALQYSEEHKCDRDVTHQFVIDFRLCILNRIKNDKSRKGTCFFIVTNLTQTLLNYVEDCDCEVIEIEATKEECLERLENDGSRKDKEKWKKKIEEYFEKKNEERGLKMNEKLERKLNTREYRSLTLEVRKAEENEMIVEGYATTFNEPYLLFETVDYRVFEQVAPSAFDGCDMSDVIMQYDHEGRVFARTKNKTLELTVDNKGLLVRANLSGTEEGRKLYQEIKDGYVDKMSFGFVVAQQENNHVVDCETGFTTITRTITKISKLYDVSAVSIPANDMTSISARNFGNGLIEEVEAERLLRNKLKLKIKLMEV